MTGNGPTYTLDTAGVPEGSITVNCTVSDDRNLTATASTAVTVSAPPPPPPPPTAKDFGSIEFKRDMKRPTRVDNEAKGELDRYADALAAAPDAKGVVVGYATAGEDTPKKGSKKSPDFAARRAVNTKDYVTKEKGIDPARIEPRTGTGDDQKTELWIVPAGATFPAEGTTVVDEAKVKPVPRAALQTRRQLTTRERTRKQTSSHLTRTPGACHQTQRPAGSPGWMCWLDDIRRDFLCSSSPGLTLWFRAKSGNRKQLWPG